MLLESPDASITADNPGRFLDAFIDELDLTEAGFADVVPKRTGRPRSRSLIGITVTACHPCRPDDRYPE